MSNTFFQGGAKFF